MALASGTRLGAYDIVDALGAAGMGEELSHQSPVASRQSPVASRQSPVFDWAND